VSSEGRNTKIYVTYRMKSYKLLYSIWSLPSLLYKSESVFYIYSLLGRRRRWSPGLDEGRTSLGELKEKLSEGEEEDWVLETHPSGQEEE